MDSPASPERRDDLLLKALALPPNERTTFLDGNCGSDLQLRRDLELQLGRYTKTGTWTPTDRPFQQHDGESTLTYEAASTGEIRPIDPERLPIGDNAARLDHRHEDVDPSGKPESQHASIGQIGEYDILAEIGRGGMGVVYKARHRVLERLVAIKIPRKSALVKGEVRFLREAKSAAALRHPNICPIYEVGHTGQHPFIALGYIEGTTLRRWARQNKPNARAVAETMAKLSRAVQYAHEHAIIHRDIKPGNVIVDAETGEPVLMDFGLAKLLFEHDSHVTKSGDVMGTPVYMAPEQAAGRVEEVGPLSDVYSLGTVLYELVTGRPPFEGPVGEVIHKVQSDEPPTPRKVNPTTHRDLETICVKAMAKEPSARYQSAGELAEDLARFSVGEPILARREGIFARAKRILVRNRFLMASMAIVALLAGASIAYFASGARTAQSVAGLTRSLNDGLQQRDWPAGHLAAMEQRIALLAELDSQAADDSREQFHQVVALRIRDEISSSASLEEQDLASIEQRLSWLLPRAADLVPPLREQLRRRSRVWQQVFHLAPPYKNLPTVFDTEKVQQEDRHLLPNNHRDHTTSPGGRILTKIPSHGYVQLTAVFQFDKWRAVQVGLLLHATEDRGYLFRVRKARSFGDRSDEGGAPVADDEIAPDQNRTTDAVFELEILRDGRLLRQRSETANQLFDFDDRTLSITAIAEGSRVSFIAGNASPLVFEDAFLHAGSLDHAFGLLWPQALPLISFEALRQPLPTTPSPLEYGDELFARKQWDAALMHYREQVGRARDELPRDQARFREALCLVQLGQESAAGDIFQALATSKDERLRLLAAFQLWLFWLRQQKFNEADAIFRNLQARYDFDELALMVPEEDRRDIVKQSYATTTGPHMFQFTASDLSFLEQAHTVAKLLIPDEEPLAAAMRQWQLLRGYHLAGEIDKGIEFARNHLHSPSIFSEGQAISIAVEYSWLLRQRGQLKEALHLVNRCLTDAEGREASMLLLERARVHAALGDWHSAEKDVETCLSIPIQDLNYQEFSAACLLRGFMYHRQGEAELARMAWERGVFSAWLEQRQKKRSSSVSLTGMPVINAMLLGALSGKMEDTEASDLLIGGLPVAGSGMTERLFRHYSHFIESAVVSMVRGERAWEVVRQMVFQEVTLQQYIRDPVALLMLEMTHQGAAPGQWNDDEVELIWQLVQDALEEYNQQQISVPQLVQLALTWRGTTSIFGWQGVAPSLAPRLRGPSAYIFGHRYRRLGRPKEAEMFFHTARDNAEPDAPLHRLASTQLRNES